MDASARLLIRLKPVTGIIVVLLVAIWAGQAVAQDFDTRARNAFLFDLETRAVLLEKGADERIAPASMAKLMTMELVFNALRSGRLNLDDDILVSEKAWRMRGSRMFIEVDDEVPVEDLVQGVVVHSGNDAAIALAEALAGTEEAFAELMNARAIELGMTNSNFRNATGWSDPEQYSTVRDLAILATHIIETYPEYYHYYSQPDYEWGGIRQSNRNPLLDRDIGVDGMKTGYLEEAGYGMVASAAQDGRRMVLVISGMSSERQREDEAYNMLAWGLRTFQPMVLYPGGEEVARVPIYGGSVSRVSAGGLDQVIVLAQRGVERADLRGRLGYEWPVIPPVERGDKVGMLRVLHEDRVMAEVPLYAMEDVDEGAIHRRALDGALEFFAQLFQ